ncbi:hypothetical protein DFH29DRAFT_240619 [Suillus ampliporus]|nr:hypothetical protein DFH29DRAFT_240619 [Suillus ampliporus]
MTSGAMMQTTLLVAPQTNHLRLLAFVCAIYLVSCAPPLGLKMRSVKYCSNPGVGISAHFLSDSFISNICFFDIIHIHLQRYGIAPESDIEAEVAMRCTSSKAGDSSMQQCQTVAGLEDDQHNPLKGKILLLTQVNHIHM